MRYTTEILPAQALVQEDRAEAETPAEARGARYGMSAADFKKYNDPNSMIANFGRDVETLDYGGTDGKMVANWGQDVVNKSESGGGGGSSYAGPWDEDLVKLLTFAYALYAHGDHSDIKAFLDQATQDARQVQNPPADGNVTAEAWPEPPGAGHYLYGEGGRGTKRLRLAAMLNSDGVGALRAEGLRRALHPGKQPPLVQEVPGHPDLLRVDGKLMTKEEWSQVAPAEVDMGKTDFDKAIEEQAFLMERERQRAEWRREQENRPAALNAMGGDLAEV